MGEIYKHYRVKPDQLKAVQVTENNKLEIAKWCGGEVMEKQDSSEGTLYIPSLQGPLTAAVGDYVAQNDKGRFEVYHQKQFEAKYEQYGTRPSFRSADAPYLVN